MGITVDIVMWTKDGEATLPQVLKSIEEAIPNNVIHRKIIVDDNSIDKTVQIAKNFGWEIYSNPKVEF
jgi:glycosyltransferase involved in cell wall biosynthesis